MQSYQYIVHHVGKCHRKVMHVLCAFVRSKNMQCGRYKGKTELGT